MPTALRPLVLGLSALFASAWLDLALAERLTSRPFDVPHVPHGDFARLAALGQRGLLSDLYWLATVQYIGDPRADARGWEQLFPLVDLVTDLDPRHGYAYQTGGIVLSAAGRLDESDRILLKGMEKGPPYWTFPYYLAFNAWFYQGDYARGAHYAEIAARMPGASPNISHLAVSLASKSGTPEDAIALLRELLTASHDPVTTDRLQDQLKLAIVERDAQQLEHAVVEYRRRFGISPPTLEALPQVGLLPVVPPDPFGGHYLLDSGTGEVRSSVNPFRFRLREGGHSSEFHYKSKLEKELGSP